MEFTDGSIVIRQYRADDIDGLYESARESIHQIYPWMEWCHPQFSRQDSNAWVTSREKDWIEGVEYSFVIADAGSGSFLGSCGINGINKTHRFANLGYWVRSSATRKGAATAAALLLARFGFEQLKLNRIEIVISVGNGPSERVAEKAGATKEGILRRRLVVGKHTHDATMYSLIREDFCGL